MSAWTTPQELVERFIAALEGAREQPGARPDANPMTAGFTDIGGRRSSMSVT
jgi:hypothetical protein